VTTGIPRLDAMMGGAGYYRGSTVLVSGTAGTGKTSVAVSFAAATCQLGERCLYFAFEESQAQIARNMQSIGHEIGPLVERGLLRFHATRPTLYGLESHLVAIHKHVQEFEPHAVVLDPVSSLQNAGTVEDATAMTTRLVDFLKTRGITSLMTDLSSGNSMAKESQIGISSVVDTWILLRDAEVGGERNRQLYILKSRGMPHSNQLREFLLTGHGVELQDVYVGPEGVLTGWARLSQAAREKAGAVIRQQEEELRQRGRKRKREALEARILAMRKEFEAEEREAELASSQAGNREDALALDREAMAHLRADSSDATERRRRPADAPAEGRQR
jgi:circadian clock protein KaiC